MRLSLRSRHALLAGGMALGMLLAFAPRAQSQAAAPTGHRMHVAFYSPPGEPLVITRPTDASFGPEMNIYFSQYAAEPNFPAVRPYFVILENTTDRWVRAYDVRWQGQLANGAVRSWWEQRIVSPLERAYTDHPRTAIPPGGRRLVSPFFDGGTTGDGWSNPQTFAALEPGAGGVPKGPFASISSRLNCVIHADGSSWGPCRHHVRMEYFLDRAAAHDEVLTVQQEMAQGDTDAQLSALLARRYAMAGLIGGNGYNVEALYVEYRGNAAEELRQLLENRGRDQLQHVVDEMAALMPPVGELTKLGRLYARSRFRVRPLSALRISPVN